MTEPTPEDLLRAAADYMDVHGKTEGIAKDLNGSVCAIGALAEATKQMIYIDHFGNERRPSFWPSVQKANLVVEEKHAEVITTTDLYPLAQFSDSHTESEVIAFLRDLSKEDTPNERS